MLARFVQKGESIDYRAETPVAAGDVIVQDNLAGIARLDIPEGKLGSLAVVGVFDIVKDDSVVTAGNAIYWNAGAKKATIAKTGSQYLGKAILDADASGETVRVLLNASCDYVSSQGSAAAIADLTDESGGTPSDIVPVSDAGSRDAVASLTAKVNAILSVLRSANIIAE